MPDLSPKNLLLRCYGYKTKKGNYVGVCLEFNLAVEAETTQQLKQKMNQVIKSYVETVLDTEDEESIAQLLNRRAPFFDYLTYQFTCLINFIRNFPGNFTFKEILPFHLAHNC
jgi:hypothetical protein